MHGGEGLGGGRIPDDTSKGKADESNEEGSDANGEGKKKRRRRRRKEAPDGDERKEEEKKEGEGEPKEGEDNEEGKKKKKKNNTKKKKMPKTAEVRGQEAAARKPGGLRITGG
eukprot:6495729-Pyramimonas_sp.AAC.1